MAVKQLVHYNDKVLHEPCKAFDFIFPQFDPVELAIDLTETMIANGGIGLSANQIGIDLKVCVIAAEQVIAMFNPIIVDTSEEVIILEEGCLSFPGLDVRVKRPRHIKVRFTRPNGETVTEKYTGMTARVMQHEIAHLEGRTMLDDCNVFEKERAKKNLVKLLRKKK